MPDGGGVSELIRSFLPHAAMLAPVTPKVGIHRV